MCCNLPQGRNSHVLRVTHGANKNGACVLARQAIHYFWAAQQQRILSQEIEQKRQEQNGPGQNGERYQSHIERHLFRFRYLWLVPYFDLGWYNHSRDHILCNAASQIDIKSFSQCRSHRGLRLELESIFSSFQLRCRRGQPTANGMRKGASRSLSTTLGRSKTL